MLAESVTGVERVTYLKPCASAVPKLILMLALAISELSLAFTIFKVCAPLLPATKYLPSWDIVIAELPTVICIPTANPELFLTVPESVLPVTNDVPEEKVYLKFKGPYPLPVLPAAT